MFELGDPKIRGSSPSLIAYHTQQRSKGFWPHGFEKMFPRLGDPLATTFNIDTSRMDIKDFTELTITEKWKNIRGTPANQKLLVFSIFLRNYSLGKRRTGKYSWVETGPALRSSTRSAG